MNALFESLTGLVFLDPWMLLLALLAIPALWLRRRRGAPAVRFAPGAFVQGMPPSPDGSEPARILSALPGSWRMRLLPLPRILQVLGLVLLAAALARPVLRDRLPYQTEGMDILLCLDTSSSMAANDMDQRRTRLEVAKEAAARFIADRPHDRLGLIRFARYPDLRCPLTLDHTALTKILAETAMVESDSPEDATGIGTAVARAAQVLKQSPVYSRLVILLTDGEENVATDKTPEEIAPLHAAQLCEELGLKVYTIVAGRGSPDQDGGWTPLDTGQVEAMADRTGGRFYRARDAGAVTEVYDSINDLEKVELVEPRYRVEDRFAPFLIAAVIVLLASRLLRSTVLEVLP